MRGNYLIEARQHMLYYKGTWTDYIQRECGLTMRTSQVYQRIAAKWSEIQKLPNANSMTINEATQSVSLTKGLLPPPAKKVTSTVSSTGPTDTGTATTTEAQPIAPQDAPEQAEEKAPDDILEEVIALLRSMTSRKHMKRTKKTKGNLKIIQNLVTTLVDAHEMAARTAAQKV